MNKPIIFKRPIIRFACTFLPWLVLQRSGGATTNKYWEKYSTDNFFTELDPASKVLCGEVKSLLEDKTSSILDLGCNVGRHLNNLYESGWYNLNGVDFSSSAIKAMGTRYPEMHQKIKTTATSFQKFLPECNEMFDLVYTRGATFELVPPKFSLIKNVCKVAKKYVVLVIGEVDHSYPRHWEYEFAREGFELVHLKRPVDEKSDSQQSLSLMTFKRLT